MRGTRRFVCRKKALLLRLAAIALPVTLVLATVSQTAFAKTYVITDGDRVVTYTTFATDPEDVLDAAGLTLDADDTYTTEGDSTINVRRAQTVSISYHGETIQTSASGETVGELLARLDMEIDSGDVLSHTQDTAVFDGMVLRVDKVVTRQETYTATLAHDVTYCNDASIPVGAEDVLIEGIDGEVLRTAEVTYINGMEVQRKVLSENVTIAPVGEVIAVGTGDPLEAVDPNGMPVIGDGYIILPTGEVLTYTRKDTVRATAYTHTDAGCDKITATGSTVHRGTVAVDPRFTPYGTRMFIIANDGSYVYGVAEAEDCGGAIKRDRMDLYFPTYEECIAFGWRTCTVYFLG